MKLHQILLPTALLAFSSAFAFAAPPEDADTCNNIHMGDWDRPVARAEQDFTLPNTGAPLRVVAHRNGGVSVRGTDTGNFRVHVCKVAQGDTEAEAQRLVSEIKVAADGNVIQPSGPSTDKSWTVFLLIEAPRSASIETETINGPLSFRNMQGALTARAQNGPVTFKNVSGTVNAEVQNGPVTYRGNSGVINIRSKNGPLQISLEGDNWNGSGLTAQTINGPLSVTLPQSYQSGIEIETDGHAPVSCQAKGCEGGRQASDSNMRHITLGSGATLVHLSTHNGPVAINDTRAEY